MPELVGMKPEKGIDIKVPCPFCGDLPNLHLMMNEIPPEVAEKMGGVLAATGTLYQGQVVCHRCGSAGPQTRGPDAPKVGEAAMSMWETRYLRVMLQRRVDPPEKEQ